MLSVPPEGDFIALKKLQIEFDCLPVYLPIVGGIWCGRTFTRTDNFVTMPGFAIILTGSRFLCGFYR